MAARNAGGSVVASAADDCARIDMGAPIISVAHNAIARHVIDVRAPLARLGIAQIPRLATTTTELGTPKSSSTARAAPGAARMTPSTTYANA